MSTLAETTTAPVNPDAMEMGTNDWIFLGIITAWAVAAAVVAIVRYRVHRPSAIAGHDRLPPLGRQWPLWVGFILVLAGWVVASIFCEVIILSLRQASGASQPAAGIPIPYSDLELAILAAVGPTAAFVIALCVIPLLERNALRWMGLGFDDLGKGLKWGALAILVVLPWMFLVQIGIISLYQAIRYQHPNEHDLLRVMKQGGETTKWLAVLGAVIVAPVFEELLFRGLLQTAITEWLTRLSRRRIHVAVATPYGPAAAMPLSTGIVLPQVGPTLDSSPHILPPVIPPDASMPAGPPPVETPAGAILPYGTDDPTTTLPSTPSPGRHRAAWIAIIVTAGLFALVHPLWTAPIIFALAVAMGYIYERTGNLWASIAVHALFNGTSTFLVLMGV